MCQIKECQVTCQKNMSGIHHMSQCMFVRQDCLKMLEIICWENLLVRMHRMPEDLPDHMPDEYNAFGSPSKKCQINMWEQMSNEHATSTGQNMSQIASRKTCQLKFYARGPGRWVVRLHLIRFLSDQRPVPVLVQLCHQKCCNRCQAVGKCMLLLCAARGCEFICQTKYLANSMSVHVLGLYVSACFLPIPDDNVAVGITRSKII